MNRFRFSDPTARQPMDAVFATGDGDTYALSSLRGRIVLVNFWASWCPPCRAEMPSLAAVASRLNGEGLVVIALGVDKSRADAERFLSTMDSAALVVAYDTEAVAARALGARGIPVSILLDRHGRELGRLEGAADWASDEAVLLLRSALSDRLGTGR